MIWARPFVFLCILGLLAGCLEGDVQWPEPEGADGGDGDTVVSVRVVEEDRHGAPVADALVRARPVVANHSTVVLQTDGDGTARFHLWADHAYVFTVRSPDHVVRSDTITAPAESGGTLHHEAAMLQRHKSVQWEAVWPGPAEVRVERVAGGIAEDTVWDPVGGLFSQNASVERAYLEHLALLDVRVHWTNNLTVHADLGIGIDGSASERPRYFHDQEDQALRPGPHEEAVRLHAVEIDRHGIRSGHGLHVGIGTRNVIVAPFDLVAEIAVEAEFDVVDPRTVPAGSAAAVLVGVLCLAALWGRRHHRGR